MAILNEITYDFNTGVLTNIGVEEVLKWIEQDANYPCPTCGKFERGIMPVFVTMMGAKLPKSRGGAVERVPPPMGTLIAAKCHKCMAVSLYSANDVFDNL